VITRIRAFAAVSTLWALPLHAVQTPQYDVPYVGAAFSFLNPDGVRNADAIGGGYALFGGWPLESGNATVEVRFIDQGMRRKLDKDENYQSSLFADYVYDFGSASRGGGFLMGTKVFVLAGLGLVREDSYGDPGYYFAVAAGGGALIPLGFRGWAIRVDGRAQAENNKDLCNSANAAAGFCTGEASVLVDYMLQAGVQIPLTMFLDKSKVVAPAEECPVTVVDPAAPRPPGCAADSDRDGVLDDADQCPGSSPGATVDAKGCAS
jgi:OOP family OmpA-OmpF porin